MDRSTSPSICVGFSQLYAEDSCGGLSADVNNNQVISYTMLAFPPGELSTVQRPPWDRGQLPGSIIRPLNPADFPCPPASVRVSCVQIFIK